MNKAFKILWNAARSSHIVVSESQKSQGLPSKAAVMLTAAAAVLGSTSGAAAYYPGDMSFVAKSAAEMRQAVASWETEEFQNSWGLTAINASSAYALGFHGQGVAVGVMDSGAYLQKHPDLAGSRFHAVHASGVYGSTGNRYQTQAEEVGDVFDNGGYSEGQRFDVDGNYVRHVNDSHGTLIAGIIGANRDDLAFHGAAWASDVYVGNTAGTDNLSHGPFPDYNFFYAGWKSIADHLTAVNGKARGGVINNSFGSNIRIGDNGKESLPTNTTAQTEYEYFLHKKAYGPKKSFIDAAWDVVKGTNIVQVFTTGNQNMAMPYHRPMFPYFRSEAENQWIGVTGLQKSGTGTDGKDTYKWVDGYNEAGNAKWWTVAAPGHDILSSAVFDDLMLPSTAEHPLGSPWYVTAHGTSMAAPFVTGALAVLMSRYPDMTAPQVRDILLTTARHTNTDESTLEGWTAADGTPDVRYGWGVPDLKKGMYGPGQFLGHFAYRLTAGKTDVWTNAITQTALDARKAEDLTWMETTKNGTDLSAEYELGQDYVIPNIEDHVITREEAVQWRSEYYARRAKAIQGKLDNNLYDGALIKSGAGTLVMTGTNTYRGGTTVKDGALFGFAESFGVSGGNASATANGKVTVKGGVFGVLETYDDTFTMTGRHTHEANAGHSVDVTVEPGGTYAIAGGQNVHVGGLILKDNARLTIETVDSDGLVAAYNGQLLTSTVTADSLQTGRVVVDMPDYAFFDAAIVFGGQTRAAGGTLTATMTSNGKTVADFALTGNGRKVSDVIGGNTASNVFASLVRASKGEVTATLKSLANDMQLAAQKATIMNSALLIRTVKDQAHAFGEAQRVTTNGVTLWATGTGSWSNINAGGASVDMDVDTYAGFIGLEVPYADTGKFGLFFGYGASDFDAHGDGKIQSDDIHIGIYGENGFKNMGLTYGLAYTKEDRDAKRWLALGSAKEETALNTDAGVLQLFGEVNLTLSAGALTVEPYAGAGFMHASSEAFTEHTGSHAIATELQDQSLGVFNVGVRGILPLTAGTVDLRLTGDMGYMRFTGDNQPQAKLTIGDAGTALMEGDKLAGMGTIGLGIEGTAGENVKFGINYTGAFGCDVTSHGVGARLRITF